MYNLMAREDVKKVLSWFLNNPDSELSPHLNLSKGYIFEELEVLGVEKAESLLEELASKNILLKKKIGQVLLCPRCSFPLYISNEACPSCKSADLKEGEVIEHYSCGYVGFEEEFKASDGSYICPSCKKKLRLIGKDYRKLGKMYRCNSCSNTFYAPLILSRCINCKHLFEIRSSKKKTLFSYRLNPAVIPEIIDLIPQARKFIPLYERHSYQTTLNPKVKGKSGIQHSFHLKAEKNGKKHLIHVFTGKKPLQSNDLLPLIAKVIDVRSKGENTDFLVMSTRKVQPEAKKMAETFGLKFLESENVKGLETKLENYITEEKARLEGMKIQKTPLTLKEKTTSIEVGKSGGLQPPRIFIERNRKVEKREYEQKNLKLAREIMAAVNEIRGLIKEKSKGREEFESTIKKLNKIEEIIKPLLKGEETGQGKNETVKLSLILENLKQTLRKLLSEKRTEAFWKR